MQRFHIFLANLFFILHCLIGIFILTGWLFPQIKLFYLAFLAGWLSCWLFLGYCPVTKWEFSLRRKYDKTVNPNNEAIQYYVYKFFKKKVSAKVIFNGGLIIFIVLVGLTMMIH